MAERVLDLGSFFYPGIIQNPSEPERSLIPYYSNPWIELYRESYHVEIVAAVIMNLRDKAWSVASYLRDCKPYSFNERSYNPRGDPQYLALVKELSEPDTISESRLLEIQKEIKRLAYQSNRRMGAIFVPFETIHDALMNRAEAIMERYMPTGYSDPLILDPNEVVNGYTLDTPTEAPMMTYRTFRKFLEDRERLSDEDFCEKYMRCSGWMKDERSSFESVTKLPYSQRMLGRALRLSCGFLKHNVSSVNMICVWVVRKLRQIQGKKIL